MSLFDPPPDLVPPANLGFPSGYPTNPYLYYRPIFARSLPIQILVTGITLTLVVVLLVQLLFSAPSHLRIARTNFFLQVSSALALLAWELSCLIIILNISADQSQRWPFMLDYIAVDFPPLIDPHDRGRWSMAALIAWLFLNAIVSVLTQVCHLHLDTLPKTTLILFIYKDHTHPVSHSHLSFPSRGPTHFYPPWPPRRHCCIDSVCAAPPKPKDRCHHERCPQRLQCHPYHPLRTFPRHLGLRRQSQTSLANRRWHGDLWCRRHFSLPCLYHLHNHIHPLTGPVRMDARFYSSHRTLANLPRLVVVGWRRHGYGRGRRMASACREASKTSPCA
jgi:hypothetical protein